MKELSICRNCGIAFVGKYCNNCGEKLFTHKDRSILHLAEEGFHFITHFDGTLIRTMLTMFKNPGRFSADYCTGIRKKYFKPLSFFLLLVVLYLIFPFFQGLNMQLPYYMHNGYYGGYATQKIIGLQPAYHDFAALSEVFHHKTEKIAKFLLFILIPMMALVSYALAFRKKRFYYDHFIFSTEILSFFILWGFLLFPGIIYLMSSVFPAFRIEDWITGAFIYNGVAIYAAIASRRFFGVKTLSINFVHDRIYSSILFCCTDAIQIHIIQYYNLDDALIK